MRTITKMRYKLIFVIKNSRQKKLDKILIQFFNYVFRKKYFTAYIISLRIYKK